MALFSGFKRPGPSGFGYNSTAEQVTEGLSLAGKTVLVTGCASGIGQEICRALSLRGAHVIGAARALDSASRACVKWPGEGTPVACDLADLDSVRACVASVRALGRPLDAIIGCAGVMALQQLRQILGVEAQFFTNHIGHFALVTGLLNDLSDDGRVVMLSSSAHRSAPPEGIAFNDLGGEKRYAPWQAYGQSKLANLLFAVELNRRFAGTGKTAYAVHPGVIRTGLARHMGFGMRASIAVFAPLLFKTAAQGAATPVFASVHPAARSLAGQYLADCNLAEARKEVYSSELAARLWAVSEELVERLTGSPQHLTSHEQDPIGELA